MFRYIANAFVVLLLTGAVAWTWEPQPNVKQTELDEDSLEIRIGFMQSLRRRMPEEDWARHIVPKLLDENLKIRQYAIAVMWGHEADDHLATALAYAINHDLCGSHIAWLLRRIKRSDIFAPELFASLREHARPLVRSQLTLAMARLRSQSPTTRAYLLDRLQHDENIEVRITATKAIESLNPNAEFAIEALLQTLKTSDEVSLQIATASALITVHPDDKGLQRKLKLLNKSFQLIEHEEDYDWLISYVQSLIDEQQQLNKDSRKRAADVLLRGLD